MNRIYFPDVSPPSIFHIPADHEPDKQLTDWLKEQGADADTIDKVSTISGSLSCPSFWLDLKRMLILLWSSLCWRTTSCLTSWMTSAKRTSAASVYGTDSLMKGRLKSSEKWTELHFSSFPFRGGVLCRIWRAIQRHRERQRTTECAEDRVWLESGAGFADRILKQASSFQLNYNLEIPQGLQQLIVHFYHLSTKVLLFVSRSIVIKINPQSHDASTLRGRSSSPQGIFNITFLHVNWMTLHKSLRPTRV